MGFFDKIWKGVKSIGGSLFSPEGAIGTFLGGPLGGIVGTAAGGLLGNVLGGSSAKDQRNFNESEAQKQRDWQEGMYDERYQKTMDDMRTAGLNPMLAYRQGTGGGVPSGAQASAQLGQEGQITASMAARGIEQGLATVTRQRIKQDTATSAAQQAQIQMQTKKTEKETTLLSKEEPWALIMEQVAKEGVKPLIDYLLQTFGTAKKRANPNKGVFDSLPNLDLLKQMRWPNK